MCMCVMGEKDDIPNATECCVICVPPAAGAITVPRCPFFFTTHKITPIITPRKTIDPITAPAITPELKINVIVSIEILKY